MKTTISISKKTKSKLDTLFDKSSYEEIIKKLIKEHDELNLIHQSEYKKIKPLNNYE